MSKSAEEMLAEAQAKHEGRYFDRKIDEIKAGEPHVAVRVFVACDACGFKQEVASEDVANTTVREHVAHCRKAHKGVVR